MKKRFLLRLYKLTIFGPLLFYFGDRSYLAYDEGFYALQARWIIENNNWIIPMWWDNYILDRTIGIQFIIAKSQTVFGENSFAAHLPTTFAAILMLFLTFKLHEELINKKGALISTLILATSYIWIDFAHLATQDMIFACLVTIGIYSLTKIGNKINSKYNILFGLWIGLGFMMKTFLVLVPLISFLPFLIQKKNIIYSRTFWFSLFIGFIPFLIWIFSINMYLEDNILVFLLDKVNRLSSKNNFTNPIYYYLWNIPINFLPWSIFSIFGLIFNLRNKTKHKYIIVYLPIILITLISCFSTKTPYYPLQISSLLAINAYIGIREILKSKIMSMRLTLIAGKVIPISIMLVISVYYFYYREFVGLNYKEELFIIIGLILFSLTWSTINFLNKPKHIIIALIIGPYLLTTSTLRSGLLNDRSSEMRESMENVIKLENLNQKVIHVKSSDINDDASHSKIIRIALMTPKLGKGIDKIEELNKSQLIWVKKFNDSNQENNSLEIIYSDENLNPWQLVKKK